MTNGRLPRARGEHSPKPLLDLRFLVLLSLSGLMVWLAVVRPLLAGAIGLGLSVLYVLHRLVGR